MTDFGQANFIGLTADATQYTTHSSPEGYLVTPVGVTKRAKIFFEDVETKVPYDPATISLTVVDVKGNILDTQTYIADGSGGIKKERTAVYYYDCTLVATQNTLLQLNWTYTNVASGEPLLAISYITVISQFVRGMFPRLKNQVDKARKRQGLEGVGYLDGNLLLYLQGGLDEINTWPPVTSFMLDSYPYSTHGQLLIDSATIVAMWSQGMFAIDTDASSYSDQGFSFTVDHQAKMDRVISSLGAKIKDQLKALKFEYAQSGSVLVQAMPYYPIGILLNTTPRGSLFRNIFVS